jgi:hypothetical protein
MRQSSKINSLVAEARMPSFGSFFPRVRPGAFASTRNALMPFCFFSRSVIMKTT